MFVTAVLSKTSVGSVKRAVCMSSYDQEEWYAKGKGCEIELLKVGTEYSVGDER